MATDIRALQLKILDITLYFDTFCRRHNITYYLMGGSALGAMRHKGFIPWDDDLDVFMTYDNYQHFLEAAHRDLDTEQYHLQEEGSREWPMLYTKLRMNGTTFIEECTQHAPIHQGVFIDIFCLNNAPQAGWLRYLQYMSARLLVARTIADRGYENNHSRLKTMAMVIARHLVVGRIYTALLDFVRRWNNRDTVLTGHYFGKAPYPRTSFPKAWLGTMRYVPFEHAELPVPEQVEKYLTLRFGDWRKIPDQKTRDKYPVHALYVDLERDYKEYLKNSQTCSESTLL